jgi:cytidyltransferase-like protein
VKPFKIFLEQRGYSVGIFPGAFKPPHKGHFDTVKRAATENNDVYVIISAVDRDGITAQNSLNTWNIYKSYLPKNVHFVRTSGSPVLVVYHIADILNNGQFTPTPRSPAPHPDAQKIVAEIQKHSGPYQINLYASQEDANDRYGSFFKNISLFKGKQVSGVHQKEVSRLASSTKAREALMQKNYLAFKKLLPPITKEDMHRVYSGLFKLLHLFHF